MRKPPIRHPERARIQPFIPGDLRDRLAAFCAASGRSESTVVAESLKRSLDPLPDAQNISEQLAQLDAFARWHDGGVHVWLAAHREVGRGEGSSGLGYDRLIDKKAEA